MNKLFLVFLAICLLSVHAFVRRDAPAPPNNENYIEEIQKKFNEVAGKVTNDLKDALNPDTIKENFNKLVDGVNQTIQNLQQKKPEQ